MQDKTPHNLMDVDTLVTDFLEKHSKGIQTIHSVYFHNNDELSVRALIAELMEELRTGCVTFLNKGSPLSELNPYLFYIVNAVCKKKAAPLAKKKTEYLCPGCLFLGRSRILTGFGTQLKCQDCEVEINNQDARKATFHKTFYRHNKSGYHCQDCERFLPHPQDESPTISCPYYDCMFVGEVSSLKKMHHPSMQSNVELLTQDAPTKAGGTFKDMIPSEEADALTQMQTAEDLEERVALLKGVIESQMNTIMYSSQDMTVKHKQLIYQSFERLLSRYPQDMVEYLLDGSRSGGFQHQVFQEYISLLESSMPFSFKKAGSIYRIESLLDDNLNLFEGISTFEGMVNERMEIKNGTKEFYIGGRKGAVTKPYYIGKLLNVLDKKTKTPLQSKVVSYSFSKIKLHDIAPGTEVIVSHLRVPPHYQMGGMSYVNRIRKKIVDRAQSNIDKDSNE